MLSLRLFGDPAIDVDGDTRPLPDRRPGRLLLGWLALNAGVHARGDVAGILWPDVHPESSRTSLRSALASVRRALGDDTYLLVNRSSIGLAGDDAVEVDAARFRSLIAAGEHEAALALYREPLLQGLDDEWVLAAREEYQALATEALAAAAQRAEDTGEARRAIELTRRLVALDDLNESAARDLIRRLAAAGDRPAALAAYDQLVERLHGRLRVMPSIETRQLIAAIRQGTRSRRTTPHVPLPLRAEGPLVGRASELETLCALARAKGTRLGLVCGEAGIGKSRLIAEVAAEAHAGGIQVLAGRCRPEREWPYAPLADALREALRHADLGVAPADLAPLLPELAEVDPPAEAGAARLYAAIINALRTLGGERRLLLIVDDVHWADPSTLRALEQLLFAMPPLELTILAAHRPVAEHADPLARWRARADAIELRLAGLDETATAALLEIITGSRPDLAHVRALRDRTGGHPLFLRELALRYDQRDAALPDRVASVVLETTSQLSPSTNRTLGVAAALGETFSFATLRDITGDEESTLDALDEAVRAALLREESPGRYTFAHTVAREAVYGALTETRRAHLHRRIAEVLAARGADVRVLAEHELRAGELGDPARAAQRAAAAAARAAERHAHEDAAVLYERALAALPVLAETRSQRCRMLLDLGRARRRAGESASVRDAYLSAAELARALGDETMLAEAALGVCSVPWFPGDAAVDEAAVELLDEALALGVETPSALRVRIRAQLARERYFSDGAAATLIEAERALAAARELGDDAAIVAALDALCPALIGQAPVARRRTTAEEALTLAGRLGDVEAVLRARIWRVLAALQAGDQSTLAADAAALEAAARELRQPAWLWWPALWRAMRALCEGDLDNGERLAVAAWELGERALGELAQLELHSQMFFIRRAQRRLDELDAMATALTERYRALPALRCVRALVDAELGRHETARDHLEELATDDFASLNDANRLVSLTLAADVCCLTDSRDIAPRLRAALAPHADELPVSGYGGVVLRPVGATLEMLARTGSSA